MSRLTTRIRIKQSIQLNKKILIAGVSGIILTIAIIVFVVKYGTVFSKDNYNSVYKFRKKFVVHAPGFNTGKGYYINFESKIKLESPQISHIDYGGEMLDKGAKDVLFTQADGKSEITHKVLSYDGEKGILQVVLLIDSISTSEALEVYLFFGAQDLSDSYWREINKQQKHRDTAMCVISLPLNSDIDNIICISACLPKIRFCRLVFFDGSPRTEDKDNINKYFAFVFRPPSSDLRQFQ